MENAGPTNHHRLIVLDPVIDWEDAAIAHPFLGLAPLTVGLGNAGLATPDNSLLSSERTQCHSSHSVGRRSCAERSRAPHLCFLDMAVRCRAQRGSMVALHRQRDPRRARRHGCRYSR
jgi:hypothetical protein